MISGQGLREPWNKALSAIDGYLGEDWKRHRNLPKYMHGLMDAYGHAWHGVCKGYGHDGSMKHGGDIKPIGLSQSKVNKGI